MVNDPFTLHHAPPETGLEVGVCMDSRWHADPEEATPWETHASEPWFTQLERFQRAREMCLQCPALAACTAYADDMQHRGWDIDGVVAGRIPAFRGRRRCHRCHRYFLHENSAAPATDVAVREHRQGLCRNCYRIEVEEPARKRRGTSRKKGR